MKTVKTRMSKNEEAAWFGSGWKCGISAEAGLERLSRFLCLAAKGQARDNGQQRVSFENHVRRCLKGKRKEKKQQKAGPKKLGPPHFFKFF